MKRYYQQLSLPHIPHSLDCTDIRFRDVRMRLLFSQWFNYEAITFFLLRILVLESGKSALCSCGDEGLRFEDDRHVRENGRVRVMRMMKMI